MADPVLPYPFPSNVHVLSSVTIKLNDSNYLLWKTQFESLLSSQKLIGFVNGGLTAPPETSPLYESWFCTDQLVRSWLFGTLSEEVLGSVHTLTTSCEIWLSLTENYNQSSLAREFGLRTSLQCLKKKDQTFMTYCREFKALCDALSAIGKPVEESMKLFQFLNGLGDEYDPVATVIQSSLRKFPRPTLNDVISEVQAYEMKLQSRDQTVRETAHVAYQTQYTGQNYGRGRGRFGQNRGRGSYSTRGRGFPQHQSSQPPSGDRPTCQICGRVGHTALKCYNRFDNNYQATETAKAFTALHVADDKEWYPDSGATAHITSSTTNLHSATPYEGSDTVMVADGAFLPITHVGSTALASPNGMIPLNDVLVCPAIKKSLLSVTKLCDDYPCGVYFDSTKVCIIDLPTQKVVTRGRRRDSLYVLEDPSFQVFFSNRHCAASEATWHHRLGHSNVKILQHLKNSKEIVINKSGSSSICEPCQMGKSNRLQFFSSDSRVLQPLAKIHCDLWGPAPFVSTQGFKYYAVFVDDFSRYAWFYPLKTKSAFTSVFISFQKMVENQFEDKIKVFQSDGGGEFMSLEFKKYLVDSGIRHQVSCPYTPEQNGVAERKHRHIVELGLSMLFHSQVPLHHWVEAFAAAVFVSNMLPSSVLDNQSPHECLLKTKPDYTMLRVFGATCYPYLRPVAEHKFDPTSLQCVFLGYSSQYKGYRCLYPPTGKVYISRHVIFDEESFPFKGQYRSLQPTYETPLLHAWQVGHPNTTTEAPETRITRILVPPSPAETIQVPEHEGEEFGNQLEDVEVEDAVFIQPANQHSMTTRAKAGIHKPNTRYALVALKMIPPIPKDIHEALRHPGWNLAAMDEMTTVHMLNTYTLVPPTEEMNILGCRWVFTTKMKPEGELDKLKARIVAKGYDQEEGVDYLETYSPVVRTATIRMILDVATAKDWKLKQLDVSSAFLHGELKEPVYMIQPPGFEDPARPHYVCKLTKALYGLKQAPRAWFDTFSNYLIDFGFVCSKSDPSLFTYRKDGRSLVLLLYVDNILLTGSDETLVQDLLVSLNKRFSMKDLGHPKYFLGVEIQSYKGGLFLHQSAYARDILHAAAMTDYNPMPTPLPQNIYNLNSELFSEPTYFRSLAGKLQYLTITRPDIQFAVNFVCQRMHQPTISDFGLLKRILRYIKGTISYGLHIRKDQDMSLTAFCDSDYGGCKETRRSTIGFSTMLGSNLISWSAKRQQTVSKSSTEAEYRALPAAAQEITWLSALLRDLGIPQSKSTLLRCDNLSAVYLSANPALHSRSKHFDTDWHYICEQVALGLIETKHIPATVQLADIFTKPLPKKPFVDLRTKLGVGTSPTTSLRGDESEQAQIVESPKTRKPIKSSISVHKKTNSKAEPERDTSSGRGASFVDSSLPEWPHENPFQKYYLVKESELQENDWIRLYIELAVAIVKNRKRKAFGPPKLEIVKVAMDANGEGLNALNAIFYVRYKDLNEAEIGKALDRFAIVRRRFHEDTQCFSLVGPSYTRYGLSNESSSPLGTCELERQEEPYCYPYIHN
ncbi:unnamed protein product [Microthlaspi erraticum]|uniref:Integrase catalytic domain-containing protein n=2 Tax=Microthlaspi erraticum TaxID=1685480 RepID=A0A6D2JJX7_9BRAS|nr:unnamed protein product [Microthlaspi erraticum]